MKSTSRPCVAANCARTSDSDRLRFCSVIRALKASRPPYRTEYRGGVPPFRTSGRCFSASSSQVVTCARMSRTDQALVTPGSISCTSDRPAYDSLNVAHAVSRRVRSCCRSTSHSLCQPDSGRSSERQIDAVTTRQGVMSRLERQDAVVEKSSGTAPDDHVTMSQWHAARRVGSTQSPEQEDGRQPERKGHDRGRKIALVLDLVQRQSRTGLVPVNETRVGREAIEAGPCRRLGREVREHIWH